MYAICLPSGDQSSAPSAAPAGELSGGAWNVVANTRPLRSASLMVNPAVNASVSPFGDHVGHARPPPSQG
jgi:hypothetical protein